MPDFGSSLSASITVVGPLSDVVAFVSGFTHVGCLLLFHNQRIYSCVPAISLLVVQTDQDVPTTPYSR